MSTPRDRRAAARNERQQHLQFPDVGLGRADLIRSRSPSPSTPGTFTFPPPPPKKSNSEVEEEQFLDALSFNQNAMATPEQLQAIRDELRNEIRAEFRSEAAAAAAQVPDAIKRKPEIPPFDRKHIDNWIRRTENAFIRALCNTPREKFAFLETKFPVDFDPRINEYLWGAATQEKWNEFLAYLRSEYGITKQQQAAVILDGLKREGKKPSQYAALLDERTKSITLDDVKKEMLIREMPPDIQRMLQERINTLSFKDAAKVADAYFDQDGKPRQANKPTTVNVVQESTSEPASPNPDDLDDIHAINRRFSNTRSTGHSNQRGSRNWPPRSGQPRTSGNRQTTQPKPTPKNYDPKLCWWHNEFGNRSTRCESSCSRYDERKFSGNGRAGKLTPPFPAK